MGQFRDRRTLDFLGLGRVRGVLHGNERIWRTNNEEASMLEFFKEGGWGMFPVLLLGAIFVSSTARYAADTGDGADSPPFHR